MDSQGFESSDDVRDDLEERIVGRQTFIPLQSQAVGKDFERSRYTRVLTASPQSKLVHKEGHDVKIFPSKPGIRESVRLCLDL